jgi:hypothetical protein
MIPAALSGWGEFSAISSAYRCHFDRLWPPIKVPGHIERLGGPLLKAGCFESMATVGQRVIGRGALWLDSGGCWKRLSAKRRPPSANYFGIFSESVGKNGRFGRR